MNQFDKCKAELILVELSLDTCDESPDFACGAAPVHCYNQMVSLRDSLKDCYTINVSLFKRCTYMYICIYSLTSHLCYVCINLPKKLDLRGL